ncbi:hypothetical protein [Acetobacter pasteurianus]|uniref:hypothetical protein n=1 Tax=Acetobacter pasteurianus TaxID=438 RepID=UPI0012DABAD3|nr:hypothetical protein [Acetobacter pasteurianus]
MLMSAFEKPDRLRKRQKRGDSGMSGSVGIVAGVSVRQGNLLLSSGFRKNCRKPEDNDNQSYYLSAAYESI